MFLRLTQSNSKPIVIDLTGCVIMPDNNKSGSQICTSNGSFYYVRELVEDIYRMIREVENQRRP